MSFLNRASKTKRVGKLRKIHSEVLKQPILCRSLFNHLAFLFSLMQWQEKSKKGKMKNPINRLTKLCIFTAAKKLVSENAN